MSKSTNATNIGVWPMVLGGILAAIAVLFLVNASPIAFAQTDTIAPTISSVAVTSDPGNGIYGIDDSIEVTVTFSEDVTVTGTPQLELHIGATPKTAGYDSVDGSAVVFSYTVAEGDSDNDGFAISANRLTLNGGSIRDAADNDADLSHDALSAQEGHQVDGIRPRVNAVNRVNLLMSGFYLSHNKYSSDGAYTIGDIIYVFGTWSEEVRVTGNPQLTLDFNGTPKTSTYVDGFLGAFSEYTVAEGDSAPDGVAILANAISLNGGSIKDRAGNDAVLTHPAFAAESIDSEIIPVDGIRPTVTSVEIVSDPGDDDTYGAGDEIRVLVTFSENILSTVAHAEGGIYSPTIELNIGGEARTAEYYPSSGSTITFAYTVQSSDTDDNGISISANKVWAGPVPASADVYVILDRPSTVATEWAAGNYAHDVTHDAIADDSGHKVDGPSSTLVISGESFVFYTENGEEVVGYYNVSGADGDITWSLSGDDSDDFSITNSGGQGHLLFQPSPNYEHPTDSDANNEYGVTLNASDGTNTRTWPVVVWVRNVLYDADEVPVIVGEARVGVTLTVDLSNITYDSASVYYKWERIDGDTATQVGEFTVTDSTYTLTADDVGKTVRVTLGMWLRGDTHYLVGEPTATVVLTVTVQNSPATGAPTISGTAQVGETLTAERSGIADADGLDNSTFSYQWLSSRDTEIDGATSSTYTLQASDEGKIIKVKVSFTDDEGNEETLTSAATGAVAARPNSAARGAPTISGTAQVGQTLTASTSGIADDDGLTNVSYTYQWIANDVISDSDIQDATLSTYTLVSDDVGKTIKVKVSFTDDADNEETLTSAATYSVVTVANPIAGICDRTEQVQDAILGMLNGVVDDCADVTGSHLARITIGLRISSNDPYDRPALSLKPGDFAGLVNIEELAIYYHTMDALPEDIFNGLGSLEMLYLSYNDIAALPEDVFDGLGNLVRLDLKGTHLSALPEDVFDGLGNLESLDLRGNQIGTLPENVFDGLGNLKSLDLGGNQLGALPEGVFDGLGSLELLELFGNRINALPEDVFDGLGSLELLRLSFNQLSALPDDVFDDLGNLVHLDMQENQIGTLPEGVYNGLSSLERLDLSYNEIAALPEDVFDGLGNLKSLRLDSNDLASPPEDVFDGLDSLTHLILSDNRIHTLPEDVFEGLGNLTYLALNTNQISVLPEDVFDELGNLTSLALDGNQLGALPEGVFDELGNLTYLSLSRNQIRALPGDFFDELGNLTSLGLGSNLLGAVPEGFFDELGNLTYLSLSRNQIRALPEDVFDGLSNLNRLDMSENRLGALPEDVFDGLGNLNRLYLYGNQLSALPEDVFDGLGNLNELYLYGNQLSALPEDVFGGLSNLNILYLWGNPGTPFTLTADLERQGDNAVLVKVAEGVPFDMEVTLSATGGTLSAASVTIKGGTAGSEAVTVTRSSDGPVTVSVASAVFQAGDYNGIQAGLGEPLILGDAEGDNRPATGTPAISDAVQVGETLTVDTSGIADEDGLDNVSYSYQWLSSRDTEIDGATGSTYTLQGTDLGKIIKVRVTFTDDAGNEETLTSAATDAVEARPNSPATGDPTISGTAQVGETLTADASGIADEDGLTNATFAYQWLADGADITGATGVTYIPVAADEGKAMNVRVTFTDDAGSEEELTSTITASVAAKANTPATGAPTIGGTVQVGETLTADMSGISDADGLTNVAYSYQWLSSRDSEIAGATSATYTLVDADGGKAIKVRVSFTDDSGNEETLTSAATGAVAARPNSAATGSPAISGTAQVGQTLTASTSGIADDDGLTNVSYTYQWIANDVISDSDIQDATLSTYTLVSDDVGKTIKVKVSFTDDADNEETLTSAATDSVVTAPASNSPATGALSITGTAQVGETLIASTTGISDTDGLTNVSYAYQWLTSRDAEIDGATSSTYTLVESDEGKTIKVRVSFTDDADSSEELTSAATSAVAAAPLTATVHDEPAPHDGQSVFTFELRFSESPKDDFSYKTLRDHAFAVTGGEVTYVRRLEPGKNVRWEITATPDSDADVSVVLPVTTDCNADGAICTGDGRMLSEEMALTVSGPAAPASNSLATGAPTITGTERVSETLTASITGIADEDGLDNVTLNYQWLADDAEINGATASTYTLADEDAGKAIKVMVSFTDDAGNDEELTSAATAAVGARPNSPATGAPTISGTVQVRRDADCKHLGHR